MAAIRDSGLAHLLAISGLHIGLVAGILFVGLRSLLALIPPVALRYGIKKWAAVAAILGAFCYAALAGGTVPTIRAFLMIALVLAGVLLDRRGLSMRMVAWAAVVLLLFQPESLLGASFQLSFAAVTALIASYEVLGRRFRGGGMGRGLVARVLLYAGGVALTTLVAGTATAPFAIYHFNRYAAYGLAANMAAVPMTALWIMPWAVVSGLLMPFGLDGPALALMGRGIQAVIDVAHAVAGWPGAVSLLPAMPGWGLGMVSLGGLWLCLWRRKKRLLGLAPIALGMASLVLVRPPDILIDGEGRLLAVRMGKDEVALSSRRTARFVQDVWLRRAGLEDGEAVSWPVPGDGDTILRCDGLGCIYRAGGRTVALTEHPDALLEDCASADLVISRVPARKGCRTPELVIDRFDLWREGAHAVWLERNGNIRVESVNESRGRRPWVVRPEGRGG